jgi:23S rRNA pseudouridine1911/1915/1917 synthase
VKDIQEQIIYEDNHLLVINKKPKQLVQGDKTGDSPLLEELREYIRISGKKPGNVFLGLTHRLDRPCSGVVVYAKTSKALERMNAIFREGKVSKTYWAVTESVPVDASATLMHFLKKNEKQNKSYVVDEETKEAKEAILKYLLLGNSDRYSLLGIELITGRHHQIRAQLSAAGCPIKGDLKYGASRSNKDGSIHLHAVSIAFEHPVKRNLMIFSAFPPAGDALWTFFMKEHPLCIDKGLIIQENQAGCVEISGINEIPCHSV